MVCFCAEDVARLMGINEYLEQYSIPSSMSCCAIWHPGRPRPSRALPGGIVREGTEVGHGVGHRVAERRGVPTGTASIRSDPHVRLTGDPGRGVRLSAARSALTGLTFAPACCPLRSLPSFTTMETASTSSISLGGIRRRRPAGRQHALFDRATLSHPEDHGVVRVAH